jgi:hypothetical protein
VICCISGQVSPTFSLTITLSRIEGELNRPGQTCGFLDNSIASMNRIIIKKVMMQRIFIMIFALSYMLISVSGQDEEMEKFIKELMNKMTLEEKIGQLNLLSIGMNVTGPILNENVEENIKKGRVGGVFNTSTPQAIRKLQDLCFYQLWRL